MTLTELDLAAIRASRLFALAPADTVCLHLQHATPVELEVGATLLEPGQEDTGIHLIVSGEIAVSLDGGEKKKIALIRAGGCIGEQSMIDDRRVTAFAVAREPSRVLSIAPSQVWELMRAEPTIAFNLIQILSESTRRNNAVLIEAMTQQIQLQLSATTDALTGLRNRRWMEEVFVRTIARAERTGATLALAMFDIDDFSAVNLAHGPAGGERVLQQVAKLATAHLRPSDQCVRYIGEKFCALLPAATGLHAERAANRLREQIVATPMMPAERHPLPVTASFGVVEWRPGMGLSDLVAAAEFALRQAKRSGCNCVVRSEVGMSGAHAGHVKAA